MSHQYILFYIKTQYLEEAEKKLPKASFFLSIHPLQM